MFSWSSKKNNKHCVAWYIVFAIDDADALAVLSASQFSLQEHNEKSSGFDCWQRDDTVLIYVQMDSNNLDGLLKQLKRNRRNQQFQGVIMIDSIEKLICQPQQARHQMLESLSSNLNRISCYLRVQLPVYLILSSLDCVRGFSQFSYLTKTVCQTEIFGITMPHYVRNADTVIHYFFQSYRSLVKLVRNKVFDLMDQQPDQQNRCDLFLLPTELELLSRPISGVIENLYDCGDGKTQYYLSGIYFVASGKNAKLVDVLTNGMQMRHGFVMSYKDKYSSATVFFLSSLFGQRIINKTYVVNTKHKERRHWMMTITIFSVILLVITYLGYMQYTINRLQPTLSQQLTQYQHDLQLFTKTPNHYIAILTLSDKLSQMTNTVNKMTSWMLLPSLAMRHKFALAKRQLDKYLLLQLAAKHINIRPQSSLSGMNDQLATFLGKHSPLKSMLTIISSYTALLKPGYNWNTVREALQPMLLTSQRLAHENNKAVFQYFVQLSTGKQTQLRAINNLIQHQSWPLNHWLIQIKMNYLHSVEHQAIIFLNQQWRRQVYQYYQQYIQGRYPFNISATDQVAISSFNHFFRPNGLLQRFANTYLQPLKNNHNYTIELSPNLTGALHTASWIRLQFFSNTNHTARLQFTVLPHSLSANVSDSELRIDKKIIRYRHGPQLATTITWPAETRRQTAKLLLADFSGHHYVIIAAGPWAWFRLLHHARLISRKHGVYLLSFHHGKLFASFLLTASANMGVSQLNQLQHFRLPNNLQGD